MSDTLSVLRAIAAELASTREAHQQVVDQAQQNIVTLQKAFAVAQAAIATHQPQVDAWQATLDKINAHIASEQAKVDAPHVGTFNAIDLPPQPTSGNPESDSSSSDPGPVVHDGATLPADVAAG